MNPPQVIKPKMQVRIPAGVTVATTGPRRSFVSQRAQVVTVHTVFEDRNTVRWVGAGGYWCEVPAATVELVQMQSVDARNIKLAPGELLLIDSIIEHIYPDPKAGSTLPVEQGELRAAKGMERKGLVTINEAENCTKMTFTALGSAVFEYHQQLKKDGDVDAR